MLCQEQKRRRDRGSSASVAAVRKIIFVPKTDRFLENHLFEFFAVEKEMRCCRTGFSSRMTSSTVNEI